MAPSVLVVDEDDARRARTVLRQLNLGLVVPEAIPTGGDNDDGDDGEAGEAGDDDEAADVDYPDDEYFAAP